MYNLVINAIKFPLAGGSVEVVVARFENRIRVTVSYTGILKN